MYVTITEHHTYDLMVKFFNSDKFISSFTTSFNLLDIIVSIKKDFPQAEIITDLYVKINDEITLNYISNMFGLYHKDNLIPLMVHKELSVVLCKIIELFDNVPAPFFSTDFETFSIYKKEDIFFCCQGNHIFKYENSIEELRLTMQKYCAESWLKPLCWFI